MSLLAITRDISDSFAACELTHIERRPIHVETARVQHEAYLSILAELGCRVIRLPALDAFPDSVFVEDVAVALGDVVILTRPGAASRRGEVPLIEEALRAFGNLRSLAAPAILDGGDVLVQGHDVFMGLSSRTNRAGMDQFAEIAEPLGYRIRGVEVRGCLHLKSAATAVGPDTILANPERIDAAAFFPFRIIPVHPDEPDAANALRIGETVLFPTAFPKTADRLRRAGVTLRPIDNSEIMKAEGALTCCSLILRR